VNTETGEAVDPKTMPLARSYRRLKRTAKAFWRLHKELRLKLYFLTLTITDEHVDRQDSINMNAFLVKLRRRLKGCHYLCLAAVQVERSKELGRPVLHWHLVIACKWMIRQSELARLWGKGHVYIKPVRTFFGLRRYLSKHVLDPDRDARRVSPRLKRWTTSRLHEFSYPEWAYQWVRSMVSQFPALGRLVVRKLGSVVGFYAKIGGEWVEIITKHSPWRLLPATGSTS